MQILNSRVKGTDVIRPIFLMHNPIFGLLSVQSLSRVRLFATPWIGARQASLSITNCQSLPKPMSIKSVMPSNHLILCRPLLLLPSIFPSIRVFSSKSALRIRWPKFWSFSFNISPSNEQPGLISFRMDWLDLLALQGTLKGILQTTFQKHQFFGAQLSFFFFFFLVTVCLFIYFFICSEFCHTLEWNSHGFTCVPIPIPAPTSLSTRSP